MSGVASRHREAVHELGGLVAKRTKTPITLQSIDWFDARGSMS
jgi:hypothetical protein